MPWGPPPPLSRSHGTHTRQGVDALVSSTLLLLSLLLLSLLLLLLLLSVSSTAPFWRAYVSGPLGVLSVRPRPLHGDPGAVLRDGGEDDPTSLTPRSSAAPCSPRRSSAPGAPSIPIPSARGERSPTRSSWQPLSSDTPIPQFYLRLLSVDPAPPVALDAFFTLRFTRPSATNDWTCYAVRALENAAATRGMGGSSVDGGRHAGTRSVGQYLEDVGFAMWRGIRRPGTVPTGTPGRAEGFGVSLPYHSPHSSSVARCSSWCPPSSDTPIPQFYLRLLSVDPAPPVALDAFFTLRFTRPSATNDWTCYAVRALENAVATRGMMESSAGGGRFDVRRRCEARWRAWVGGVRFRHGFSARA
jgi:hypothetical protein